jgi:probable F420-dependent oxidoreductase
LIRIESVQQPEAYETQHFARLRRNHDTGEPRPRQRQNGEKDMQLGRLGVWYGADRLNAAQLRDLLAHIEGLGYAAYWYPEALGYESMSLGSFLLANSRRLVIGSSIANIYARDAYAARRGLATLNGLYGDRFILGLGVSHVPLVEKLRGQRYDKPIPTMRAYLDGISKDQQGAEEWPIVLAALGPKMLALAAERTRGAVPYNVTPEHTAQAAAILGPSKWLAVEQKVCLETDPARARALGRAELARYMVLPNYRNNWLRLGFSEAELADGGGDRFIDAMVLWGDADTVKRGLRAHFDAGATHVCIQPVHAEADWAARDRMLTALADT